MRSKVWAIVLMGLGGFLLVVAVMAVTWAPGHVKKTPINVNTTTILEGTAAKLDTATGAFEEKPIYALSITKSDSKASDSKTAVFVQITCVVVDTGQDRECVQGSDPNLVSASVDTFAVDRKTALSVDSPKLPADAGPHEGLQNKWPFNAQKKTYPYWDGTLGKAVDAVYNRTTSVDGETVFVYRAESKDAPINIADGVPGTYTDVSEIYVEPYTGAIVDQTDDQQRYLADGTQVLDLKLDFTDAQKKTTGDLVKSKKFELKLLLLWAPIAGFVGGLLALLAGGGLLLRSRRDEQEPAEPDSEPVSLRT